MWVCIVIVWICIVKESKSRDLLDYLALWGLSHKRGQLLARLKTSKGPEVLCHVPQANFNGANLGEGMWYIYIYRPIIKTKNRPQKTTDSLMAGDCEIVQLWYVDVRICGSLNFEDARSSPCSRDARRLEALRVLSALADLKKKFLPQLWQELITYRIRAGIATLLVNLSTLRLCTCMHLSGFGIDGNVA